MINAGTSSHWCGEGERNRGPGEHARRKGKWHHNRMPAVMALTDILEEKALFYGVQEDKRGDSLQ